MGHIISKSKSHVSAVENHFVTDYLNKNKLSILTRNFFRELQLANADIYNNLLCIFSEIVDTNKPSCELVFIKPYHFDIVGKFLHLQRSLPENARDVLTEHLRISNYDIVSIMQGLREAKLQNIELQTNDQNLSHHTFMHAQEMRVRVMQVICSDLNLYNTDSEYDLFMRHIIMFALEFHDYIQGSPEGYPTVEDQTAAIVLSWLVSPEGLGTIPNDVYIILKYQIYFIISIATTVAFSTTSPLELSRILSMFEKACIDANINICHPSNDDFCRLIKLTANIAGSFDTIPCVMQSVCIRQASVRDLSSENNLIKYFNYIYQADGFSQNESQLLRFTQGNFSNYFSTDGYQATDAQAFLTGLGPKLGMRIEFAMRNESEASYALLLGKFIHYMKMIYFHTENETEFFRNFDDLFDRFVIANAVDKLFMDESKIIAEADFTKSNFKRALVTSLLINEHNELNSSHALNSAGYFASSSIISPKAVLADARNIQGLYNFYINLPLSKQLLLLKELVLNFILQVGTIYAKRPELTNLLDEQSRINLPNLITLEEIERHADSVPAGKFNDICGVYLQPNSTRKWQYNPAYAAVDSKAENDGDDFMQVMFK